MQCNMNKSFLYPELSKIIVDAYYEVCKGLQAGMLEEVYQKALVMELRSSGRVAEEQRPLTVTYKGVEVGFYKPDIIVDNKIIIELKAADSLSPKHSAQLINYLSITGLQIGYLLNFGLNRRFVRLANPNLLHE